MSMRCRVCGCTTDRACPGGCSWVSTNPPICSACLPPELLDDDSCPAAPDGQHVPLWLNRRSGICTGCRATIIACEAA